MEVYDLKIAQRKAFLSATQFDPTSRYRHERLRAQILRLLAQGAAGPFGEHHEGNRAAARHPFKDVFGRTCQQLVRQELRGGD